MSLEKDVTQIKALVEQDDIFKPASPANLAQRRENMPLDPYWIDFDTWVIMARDRDHAEDKAIKYLAAGIAPYVAEVSNASDTTYTKDTLGNFVRFDITKGPDFSSGGPLPVVEATNPIFKAATPEQIASRPNKQKDYIEFITKYVESVKKYILNHVNNMPDNWEGAELKKYAADIFAMHVSYMDKKRTASYNNDMAVNDL